MLGLLSFHFFKFKENSFTKPTISSKFGLSFIGLSSFSMFVEFSEFVLSVSGFSPFCNDWSVLLFSFSSLQYEVLVPDTWFSSSVFSGFSFESAFSSASSQDLSLLTTGASSSAVTTSSAGSSAGVASSSGVVSSAGITSLGVSAKTGTTGVTVFITIIIDDNIAINLNPHHLVCLQFLFIV